VRRAGGIDRGCDPSRGARGSGARSAGPALLREPVLALPALAHDRLHRRARGGRHSLRSRRDRRGALVRSRRCPARALAAAIDLAGAHGREPAEALKGGGGGIVYRQAQVKMASTRKDKKERVRPAAVASAPAAIDFADTSEPSAPFPVV